MFFFFFFFNDTATTEIYTLSLHDALPISEHFAVRPPHTLPVGDVGQVHAGPDHVVERRAGLDERPLDVLERLDRLQVGVPDTNDRAVGPGRRRARYVARWSPPGRRASSRRPA